MRYPRYALPGWETTETLAFLAAFHRQGCTVQPVKDWLNFLDPRHHQLANAREPRNAGHLP